MKTNKLIAILSLICAPGISHAAEPVINISNSNINVESQTSSNAEILQALSRKLGFQISGNLESTHTIDYMLSGKPQKLIEQLVKPQSIAIIYRDEHGVKKISNVELISTGTVDTKYTINASDGEKPLVGTQQQIEKRMAHNERREKNRTKKISEGTLCCDTYYKNKGN